MSQSFREVDSGINSLNPARLGIPTRGFRFILPSLAHGNTTIRSLHFTSNGSPFCSPLVPTIHLSLCSRLQNTNLIHPHAPQTWMSKPRTHRRTLLSSQIQISIPMAHQQASFLPAFQQHTSKVGAFNFPFAFFSILTTA